MKKILALLSILFTLPVMSAAIYIDGDISAGTGQLVISDDIVFDINSANNPNQLLLGWNTGFGQYVSIPGSNDFLTEVFNSNFVVTAGGTLDVRANVPFSASSGKFVGSNSSFGANGIQSDVLTSGPLLFGAGTNTRLFFSDTFQQVRQLDPGSEINQLIIGAGTFDLPQINGFVLPGKIYADWVQVRGNSQFGFPVRSERVLLTAPQEVSEPASLAILGLGLAGFFIRRRIKK